MARGAGAGKGALPDAAVEPTPVMNARKAFAVLLVAPAEVTCPWHGARFDIKTGVVLGPPAGREVRNYPVRVTGADIEIEV